MKTVNRRDKRMLARLIAYIRDRSTSEPEKLEIYSYLQSTRGKGIADFAMVLIRAYRAESSTDNIKMECQNVFSAPRLKTSTSLPLNERFMVGSFCIMALVILALIVLALVGYTIPKEQYFLISILLGMLVAAMIFAGCGTATVDAVMPTKKGLKLTIKMGGAGAGLLGTIIILQKFVFG